MDAGANFISWSRGYLNEEYRIKIRKTVRALPPELLWWRPNEQANSVGNLLMHLEGNVRQWIVGGVRGARERVGRRAARAARADAGRSRRRARSAPSRATHGSPAGTSAGRD